MKKNLWFVIYALCLFNFVLFADQVDFETCKKIAEYKLTQLEKSDEFHIYNSTVIFDQHNENVLFYIFDLQPEGYIVTTAENDLPPIIAYSFISSFFNEENGNILLDFLKTDVMLRLKNIPSLPDEMISNRNESWNNILTGNSERNRFEQWPPAGTTPTGGWLLENWTQNAPYNNFCPMDNVTGNRSIAGCPSIAMAQILHYNRSTNDVFFDDEDDYYHNYSGRQYWIDDDYIQYEFLSFPQMNTNLDTLKYHYLHEEPITSTDKASLVFACGVAAQQVYTSQISGTFGVNQAHQAYQKFNFDDAQLIDETSPDFYEQITQNMIDELPVHFASVTPAGDAGHNFVIDGYNSDEYYHINFGWGGTYNGWYLLPDEIPYGLTVVEGAIVDIAPDQITGFIEGQIALTPAIVDTSNITILLQNLAGEYSFEIEPDISGITEYEIEVPIGNYTVTASYPGYEIIFQSNVFIEEQLITNLDFTLFQLVPPNDLTGEIIDNEITLNWQHSQIRDLQYFKIYRNIDSGEFVLLDTTDQLSFVDIVDPLQSAMYGYYIIAIYSQENESSGSNEVYLVYVATSAENDIVNLTHLSNYPNPFNPSTIISFSLTTDITEYMELAIYNLKGQKIKDLSSSLCHAEPVEARGDNEYIVTWNGKDDKGKQVSSGVYLYRLKSGNFESTKKMLLLK